MKKYYDRANHRLIFLSQAADSSFWDDHWQTPDLEQAIKQDSENNYCARVTKRFLTPAPSTKVLDGGCGRGQVVYALSQTGYNAYGVDFAKHTVQSINQAMPDLQISYGNVTQLKFPDNYFDGYWSLGVIEHSYHGYQDIAREMHRVIKPGGYLFITYPHLSLLRKIKISLGFYPTLKPSVNKPNNFYQFALNKNAVSQDLTKLGFILKYQRQLDGFKGLKDEVSAIRPLLRKINSSPAPVIRYLRSGITEATASLSGHVMLQVLQKQ